MKKTMTNAERAELFGCLIDCVEDFLDEKGITIEDIPNEEREDNDAAIIYGSDYDDLADRFANVLGISRYEEAAENESELLGEKERISFEEFQKGVLRTASPITLATKENMRMNSVLGSSGEVGELVDLLKKELFQGHPFDRERYIKECGDVLYYLGLLAESLDTTLEEIALTNNKKLHERYPNGFSAERSLHRKVGDI